MGPTLTPRRRHRPADPYDTGEEPDPRFTLANERTFLAWQRTALALIAGGIGIEALTAHSTERDLLAVFLVLAGVACAVTALRRWSAAERAMRTGRPLPRFRAALAFPAAIAAAGVLVILMVVR
ncbi:DUF202 domain-containing protein [Streptomyces sp. NPDC048659]|uniref:YidH family protein n=1 Tax=Streptomyces sp. NPDC048659 TaxID=3155489 RepID=UPI003425402F